MTKNNVKACVKYLWLLPAVTLLAAIATMPVAADTVRIYVTNSAGDSVHVIDPATNKVVQEIKGIEAAHGINFSPDGARVYISNEAAALWTLWIERTARSSRRFHSAATLIISPLPKMEAGLWLPSPRSQVPWISSTRLP